MERFASLPCKILEKLMHKQLTGYIEGESLLSNNQPGFRKEHSTVHSVAQVTTYISKKADTGLPTLAAFVDFRKAFDCVQHQTLLNKLSAINIDGKVIDWFESYLTDRKQ